MDETDTWRQAPLAPPMPSTLPPPPPPANRRKPRRPAFGLVIGATVLFRVGREVLEVVARSSWGPIASVGVAAIGVLLLLGWRLLVHRKVRGQGGVELTPELAAKQFSDSGLDPPAFPEDGTLLGASVLVVSQRTKLIELNTEYDLFSSTGRRLGEACQVGQSRAKHVARLITAFDQFMTHVIEVRNADGSLLMRLTRPRKLFLSRIEIHDAWGRLHGTMRQKNVFGRIRFDVHDHVGSLVGGIRAESIKAWDFDICDPHGRPVGRVVKSWEGWARTAWSRADRYVSRLHEPLPYPLRLFALAAPLAVDLALKQDARGLG